MDLTEDTAAPYHVAYVVSPPTTLSYEAFAAQALAAIRAAGPHYLAVVGMRHTPAYEPNLQKAEPASTLYLLEVWDLRGSTPACPKGALCFSLYAPSAPACLAQLDQRLRGLAQREDEAVPTRYADAELESLRQLEAAA